MLAQREVILRGKLKVFVPLITGQTIPDVVMDSIMMQTVPVDVVKVESEGTTGPGKRMFEGRNRDRVCSLASKHDKAIMQDRDVVNLLLESVSTVTLRSE